MKEWIKSDVIRGLVDALEDASTSIPEDRLWVEVEKAVDNIDVAHVHLKTAMLKHNVAVYIAGGMPISELPREDWTGLGSTMPTRCQLSTTLLRLHWLGGAPM